MKSKPLQEEAWSKKFDKLVIKNADKFDGTIGHKMYKDVKAFIRSDHARIKKEIEKRIKKEKLENMENYGDGWNNALAEVRQIIEEIL
jgi:lysozyme family protein